MGGLASAAAPGAAGSWAGSAPVMSESTIRTENIRGMRLLRFLFISYWFFELNVESFREIDGIARDC